MVSWVKDVSHFRVITCSPGRCIIKLYTFFGIKTVVSWNKDTSTKFSCKIQEFFFLDTLQTALKIRILMQILILWWRRSNSKKQQCFSSQRVVKKGVITLVFKYCTHLFKRIFNVLLIIMSLRHFPNNTLFFPCKRGLSLDPVTQDALTFGEKNTKQYPWYSGIVMACFKFTLQCVKVLAKKQHNSEGINSLSVTFV